MELDQGGESANALKKLHEEAGWPSSRIILTYQSFDAARSRAAGHTGLLPGLGRLLGNTSLKVSIYGEPYTFTGPYAGVLGWPEPMPPIAKYLFTYLFAQAEFGLLCPVSMTDSAYSFNVHPRARARCRSAMLWAFDPVK